MSKDAMPLYVGDVSVLARNLRHRLEQSETVPGHVEMLNILARAGGYRNFQHLKAQHDERRGLDLPERTSAELNLKLVKRIVRLFDEQGYLTRWPRKYSERILCLWVMWSRIESRRDYNECQISELLEQQHLFEDHALLRRELADHRMVERTPDGRCYRRVEVQPPAEALEVFRHLR